MTKHFVTDEDITELIERLKPPISEYGRVTVSCITLLDAGELLERYLKEREAWRKTLVMEREVLLHATRLKDQYKRERDDARQQIESLLPFRMQEPKGVPTVLNVITDDVLKHRPCVNHCSFNCENLKTFEYEGKRYCSYCWCNFARLIEISGSL